MLPVSLQEPVSIPAYASKFAGGERSGALRNMSRLFIHTSGHAHEPVEVDMGSVYTVFCMVIKT